MIIHCVVMIGILYRNRLVHTRDRLLRTALRYAEQQFDVRVSRLKLERWPGAVKLQRTDVSVKTDSTNRK